MQLLVRYGFSCIKISDLFLSNLSLPSNHYPKLRTIIDIKRKGGNSTCPINIVKNICYEKSDINSFRLNTQV